MMRVISLVSDTALEFTKVRKVFPSENYSQFVSTLDFCNSWLYLGIDQNDKIVAIKIRKLERLEEERYLDVEDQFPYEALAYRSLEETREYNNFIRFSWCDIFLWISILYRRSTNTLRLLQQHWRIRCFSNGSSRIWSGRVYFGILQ